MTSDLGFCGTSFDTHYKVLTLGEITDILHHREMNRRLHLVPPQRVVRWGCLSPDSISLGDPDGLPLGLPFLGDNEVCEVLNDHSEPSVRTVKGGVSVVVSSENSHDYGRSTRAAQW